MVQVLKAHKVGSSSRRPKTYRGERICGDAGCSTILSRYNKAEYCHTHAPKVFPRLRGVIIES